MIIEYQQLDTEIDIQPETIPDNEKLKDMPLVFHQSIRIELREEDADFTDLKVVELLLIILSLLEGVLIGPQYILQFIYFKIFQNQVFHQNTFVKNMWILQVLYQQSYYLFPYQHYAQKHFDQV